MSNTLFLILESPLQSWGERSMWDHRDTSLEPTKSGIVGMLGCALGISDPAELSSLSQKLEIGIRVDRAGYLLEDFQIVSSGSRSANGKKRDAGIVITKQYLCDACFLVAVRSDPETVGKLAQAVQNPKWVPYLGRKCCVPSTPLYSGESNYADIRSALCSHPISDRTDSSAELCLILDDDQRAGATKNDEISSELGAYKPRFIKYEYVDMRPASEKEV